METIDQEPPRNSGKILKMLGIEENLSSARKDEYRKAYDRILVGIQKKCLDAEQEGLDAEDFEKCGKLKEAVLLSRKILKISKEWF